MNALGMSGADLHGMIGYTILARYRMELDFTRDKLKLTPLDYDPPVPQGLDGKAVPTELDALGGIIKILATLMGKKPVAEVKPRGFLGIELADENGSVSVKAVLAQGPAAADLRTGDRITQYQGEPVKTVADLQKLAAKLSAGESVKLGIQRGSETRTILIKAGEGL